jgi:hypothetical protein
MFKHVFTALFKIAADVRRIREILEVAHANELQFYDIRKKYSEGPLPDHEVIVDSNYQPRLDAFGEVIEPEE